MRKFLLLFAAMLSIAPLARANSIDYDTGLFVSGTMSGSFATSINVSITGSLNTIDLITGTLVQTTAGCPAQAMCFNFTGGSVKVSNASGTVFSDVLSGGITIRENGSASINAVLMANGSVSTGTATASFNFDDGMISSGSEDVSFTTPVPEPSSALLLSAGLIGLAALQFRRSRRA